MQQRIKLTELDKESEVCIHSMYTMLPLKRWTCAFWNEIDGIEVNIISEIRKEGFNCTHQVKYETPKQILTSRKITKL